jgi:hypothetical protein
VRRSEPLPSPTYRFAADDRFPFNPSPMLIFHSFFRIVGCALSIQNFTQRVDHFNFTNSSTFPQRFIVSNLTHNTSDREIILEIPDLHSLDLSSPFSAAAHRIANATNALLVSLEPRYFGLSVPDSSFNYLQIHQILADHVYFLRSQYPHAQRVLAIGGGWGGTIATWLRVKYPYVISASWASSAPLKAVWKVPNFWKYYSAKLDHLSSGCSARVNAALINLSKLYGNHSLFNVAVGLAAMELHGNHNYSLSKLCHGEPDLHSLLVNRSGGEALLRLRCRELGGFHIPDPFAESLGVPFFRSLCGNGSLAYDTVTNIHYLRPRFARVPGGETMQFSYNSDDVERDLMVEAANPSREMFIVHPAAHGSPAADLRAASEGEDEGLPRARDELIERASGWLSGRCNTSCAHGDCYGNTCICQDGYNGEMCTNVEFVIRKNKWLASCVMLGPTVILLLGAFVAWRTVLTESDDFRQTPVETVFLTNGVNR